MFILNCQVNDKEHQDILMTVTDLNLNEGVVSAECVGYEFSDLIKNINLIFLEDTTENDKVFRLISLPTNCTIVVVGTEYEIQDYIDDITDENIWIYDYVCKPEEIPHEVMNKAIREFIADSNMIGEY